MSGFFAAGTPSVDSTVLVRHSGVDGRRIDYIRGDDSEPVMVERKRVGLPGHCGDLASGGECDP
ncbi:hypothetical protein ITI46_09110 [Streptomyces oryzae]|uniref:Uncharacterized protein n=1 Tax=Streptomyces oryzae TaxID=1434886 RepID=A0ABS3X8Z4_9ACTN|nr:hypothetical protein [Streptomyces oryzae]MBO8191834.1 hypothetical protein [Streptomyces oryzae]